LTLPGFICRSGAAGLVAEQGGAGRIELFAAAHLVERG